MNSVEKALMQSAFLTTGEIAGVCNEHDLDFTQVLEAYQRGSSIAAVALLGEAGGWPAEHVELARKQYKIPPPKSIVICVRDPDYENTFERFGDPVSIIDIDLGKSAPEEYDADWIEGYLEEADRLLRWKFDDAAENLVMTVITNSECTGHYRQIDGRAVIIHENTCSLHEVHEANDAD